MMRATRRSRMNKKDIVRLTDQEPDELAVVIKKFQGTSQKVRRAQILSKADAAGPNWIDHRIAEAFGCRTRTVEKLRQRLVECGFRETLDGVKRELPPGEHPERPPRHPLLGRTPEGGDVGYGGGPA